MASISRRSRRSGDIWPGFVDALSGLLLVIIFVLLVFVLAQFFLGQALTGRDEALERLNRQVAELSELLSLEREANAELRLDVAQLSAELQSSTAAREQMADQLAEMDDLRSRLAAASARAEEAEQRAAQVEAQLADAYQTIEADRETIEAQLGELALLRQDVEALQALKAELEQEVAELGSKLAEREGQLAEERRLSEEARAHAAILNRRLQELRAEIARLANALDASEATIEEQQAQIADLGRRLNRALANKVEELRRARSEFFGRLREVLGDRPGIRVEGDRFVFQSELLFASGSAEVGEAGRQQLEQLARTLNEVMQRIPEDLDWVLRVDGHTDKVPINNARFESNWELSLARAMSVVRFLIEQGIPADRLAAAGFGEHHPVADGESPEDLAKNRRIELRLDQA